MQRLQYARIPTSKVITQLKYGLDGHPSFTPNLSTKNALE